MCVFVIAAKIVWTYLFLVVYVSDYDTLKSCVGCDDNFPNSLLYIIPYR